MYWRFSFVLVVKLSEVVFAMPPGPSSGIPDAHIYWKNLYDVDYGDSSWSGFSNGDSYEGSPNPGACQDHSCSYKDGGIDCSTFTGTCLRITSDFGFRVIREGKLPNTLTELYIANTNLEEIEEKVFLNLTSLTKLTIIKSQLTSVPDLTYCTALEELDLFNNKIQYFVQNYTYLPQSLKKINLIQNNINYVPNKLFDLPDLEYISLANNKMDKFPGSSFANNKNLKYIGVEYNMIKFLSYPNLEPFFINSSQLVHLNASYNQISSITPQALQNLIHLKILELRNNSIVDIRDKTFYNIPELMHLDLTSNLLEAIVGVSSASPFEDLPKLQRLILTGQITANTANPKTRTVVYNAFVNLPVLEELWLDHNEMIHFPHPALSQEVMTTLKYLHLENNRLNSLSSYSSTDFPADMAVKHRYNEKLHEPFMKMTNLKALYLHYNQIPQVDEEHLWFLNDLTELYLGSNLLTNATIHPFAFRNLTSLNILHLDVMTSSPRMQYVPAAVQTKEGLPAITELDLSSNKLTYLLNGTFVELDTLRTLSLFGNNIVAIENGVFPASIQSIDLSNNKFRFKHENPFTDLATLSSLTLSNNEIDDIPDSAFHGLTSLSSLYLGNNQIGRILKVAFKDLEKLSTLTMGSNELAYIENGTFTSITRPASLSISFNNNQLTAIPNGGDFDGLSLRKVDFSNNRITSIESNTFLNAGCSGYWNFRDNSISIIKEDAFVNITSGSCLVYITESTDDNPLKDLEPLAFHNVQFYFLYLSNTQLSTLKTGTFKDVTLTQLSLQSNQITSIEDKAFDFLKCTNLYLSDNGLLAISGPLFGPGSSAYTIDLSNNDIQSVSDSAFDDVTISKSVKLNDNKIAQFPSKALKANNLLELDLSNNQVNDIPVGDFAGFTSLQKLYLSNNNITTIGASLFEKLSNLKILKLDNNKINSVIEDAFKGLVNVEEILLNENQIPFIPAFPTNQPLIKLKTLNLYNNLIENLGQDAFSDLSALSSLNLGGTNILECDCNIYNTLVEVISAISAATCESPDNVKGVTFTSTGTYLTTPRINFTCAPVNVTTSAPADYQLKVDWEQPPNMWPVLNSILNSTSGNNTGVLLDGQWNSTTVTVTYDVTCSGTPPLVHETSQLSWTFVKSDGVKAGTDYTCYVQMKITNGSMVYLSAKSEISKITTLEGKTPVTNTTVNATNYYLDIQYFDFQASHPDFLGVGTYQSSLYNNPQYIASPYDPWLSISNNPTADTFSDWFRKESTLNMHYDGLIELGLTYDKDANGNSIHRYYNPSFFPVDGKGFGAEGQRDCYTNTLRNYGFTSTVQTGFKASGSEILTFAGGEELWVFINKKLVVQIFHDPSVSAVPCRQFNLSAALQSGGGDIVPYKGSLVGSSCDITGAVEAEKFNLDLQTGVPYRLDIFLAERFPCDSKLFIQSSGTSFLRQWESTNPADYYVPVNETIDIGSKILEFLIADAFSTGPYTVDIMSGNEEDRFAIEKNTYSIPVVNPPPDDPSFTWNGESVYTCPNATNVTTPIPKTNLGVQTLNNMPGDKGFLIVKNALDYEWTKEYILELTVTDTFRSVSGNITIMLPIVDINDNCPILPNLSFTLQPIPPLQILPFYTIFATDLDSDENGRITYTNSEVLEAIPKIEYEKFTLSDTVLFVNTTVEWTLKYNIYAVDNGSPRRGDSIPITVTINATCYGKAAVFVNETSGEIFLRAPTMTNSEYPKSSTVKPMCRSCTHAYYCPGDGTELKCATTIPTEYSFGAAESCSSCPEGWLCHNGTALPCPADTHVKCNDTWCPTECFACEPGTVCFQGKQTECKPGTYSDGTGFPCKLCPPGSYNNVTRATTCECCTAGYTSTHMKYGCEACPYNEWSELGSFPYSCGLCHTCETVDRCPCLNTSSCFEGVQCHNLGYGLFSCDECPLGFELKLSGSSCADVDECTDASPCFNASTCVNLSPGYRCGGCPAGYVGNAPSGIGVEYANLNKQNCTEIDECSVGTAACDPNAQCVNTLGSYTCGPCNPGYIGNGYTGCVPGDLCSNGTNTCHSDATCFSTGAGKYICKCDDGFGGNGFLCGPDYDMDGIPDSPLSCTDDTCKKDNCYSVPNEGQEDADNDTLGNACDEDDDNDNILDEQDNCQFVFNIDQVDTDKDGVGDLCDNCVNAPNPDQADHDNDGVGDECDGDDDGDGVSDSLDNCTVVPNPGQENADGDLYGDACDNCKNTLNNDQTDSNQNGYGDACDGAGKDRDGDSVLNDFDNCGYLANAGQADKDNDGEGDDCDDDDDNDGKLDTEDNCPLVSNPSQEHVKLAYDQYGNAVGDACSEDYDGDGTLDYDDTCPHQSNIQTTSFEKYFLVRLDTFTPSPTLHEWTITNKGRDIEQFLNTTNPSMLIGEERYGPVDYTGTMYVKSDIGMDYIGIVFGYQNNGKFYVVMWRHKNINLEDTTYLAGIKGLQIKLVDWPSGPGTALAEALWNTLSTESGNDKVSVLWHDPLMQGWEHKTPYSFHLTHRPSTGRIRLIVRQGSIVLADSGDIYDTTITGGRLGVFTYGQDDVIWSRLRALCAPRENLAFLFDGVDGHVSLPSIHVLGLTDSFTISTWVHMTPGYPSSVMPLVCSLDRTLCLYIKDKTVRASLGDGLVNGTQNIDGGEWHHVAMRYDAQRHELEVFVNGTSNGKETSVTPYTWPSNTYMYLGRDSANFLKGYLDETTLWGVAVEDSDITKYMKEAGLLRAKYKGLIIAHYDMNQQYSSGKLLDQGNNNHQGDMLGGVKPLPSSLDKSRFKLTFPSNRRRRRSLSDAEYNYQIHTEL